MNSSDLEYELPAVLHARTPLPERGTSKLMLVHRDGRIEHLMYRDLADVIGGDLIYLNNSKVRNRSLGRTQPIYATKDDGGLASPTAGLDITPELLDRLNHKFLTLHVGMDTFQHVITGTIEEHVVLAAERYHIPEPPTEPVIAVGTTVTKALETYAQTGKATGESKLLIIPPFTFQLTKALLTTFHVPRHTHLALTWAFAGRERTMEAYALAIERQYRFGGYGDAALFL